MLQLVRETTVGPRRRGVGDIETGLHRPAARRIEPGREVVLQLRNHPRRGCLRDRFDVPEGLDPVAIRNRSVDTPHGAETLRNFVRLVRGLRGLSGQ